MLVSSLTLNLMEGMMATVKLMPGSGYWDISKYPLGGDFRRAGQTGLLVRDVSKLDGHSAKADSIGLTEDGRRIAFCDRYADPI